MLQQSNYDEVKNKLENFFKMNFYYSWGIDKIQKGHCVKQIHTLIRFTWIKMHIPESHGQMGNSWLRMASAVSTAAVSGTRLLYEAIDSSSLRFSFVIRSRFGLRSLLLSIKQSRDKYIFKIYYYCATNIRCFISKQSSYYYLYKYIPMSLYSSALRCLIFRTRPSMTGCSPCWSWQLVDFGP